MLIVVNAKPAVLIDIPDHTECTLKNLKLSHSGEGEKAQYESYSSFKSNPFFREQEGQGNVLKLEQIFN